ncbi:NADH-quinone oxidoreductase subunit NuoE [Candidatus Contubernalis alkaliaceticus]|uniref:NADH-quinone oxidoreductase subunit NuoE n=1 Tax=Candidatus Contubernalis alkaliaceticus TaxID=338645 RepID=UPI001F4C0D2F|nr:NADH-quinone oxidoreductase subunit NuoE [Candidatus Contubernalis alkalaceticus]UNC91478.1 NADH-quinone oxidoreductase subunit NuoE [Candidatus Contubernalis alkalaceticus]
MSVQQSDFDYKPAEEIVEKYKDVKGNVIPILQAVQNAYGYLPREAMQYVAKSLRVPFSRIFGVVTFYAQFHLKPRGKYIIRVCKGTACHVRGGAKIADRIMDELDITVGATTPDLKFTMETVACIGACGLAPVLMVNEDTHGRLTPDLVPPMIKQYANEQEG